MRKTSDFNVPITEKILLTDKELQALLGVGRKSAVEISIAAGARISIGKLKRNNRKIIEEYLNKISDNNGGN